jgi:ubiquitin C-terminal hydrolase
MPLLFRNKGATCFFNVAAQLCLNNPEFRRAIRSSAYDSYGPFVQIFRRYCDEVESCKHGQASIASVDGLLPHFEFLRAYVASHQQGDVLECVDAILDKFCNTAAPRPAPMNFTNPDERSAVAERVRAAIRAHCGPMEALWGIQEQVSECMSCRKIVLRELIPFSWIARVSEERVYDGVCCDLCHVRGRRTSVSRIYYAPPSLIVQVPARHRDDGSKDNRPAIMNECVELTDASGRRPYYMAVMVYHQGWSFQGGHYTCAFRTNRAENWILNSDASCSFAQPGFDIEKHQPQSTYAMLYLRA